MRATDIDKLIALGRPAIAPDGTFAVFATSRPDLPANRYVGQLWRVELPGGRPRRITRGTADSAPRIGPDGQAIAFLRADAKGTLQLFAVGVAGGEPVQVTDVHSGVGEFAWAPQSDRLAFTARVAENGRYGTIDGLSSDAEAPRRITGIRWHANGLGYIGDRPAHVFVVDAPALDAEPFYEPATAVRGEGEEAPAPRVVAAEPVQLTDGTASHRGVVFSADGREVLTVREEIEHSAHDMRTPLIAIAVDGSGERELLGRSANVTLAAPVVASDGAVAALAGEVGPGGVDFIAAGVGLVLIENGTVRALTDPAVTDLEGGHITPLGDDFLVQNVTRGRVSLLRVSRDAAARDLTGADVEVVGHDAVLRPEGERIVASIATEASFGELIVVGEGEPTAFGAALQQSGLVRPTELEILGRDGYPVHGWVAVPEGEGTFPVILQIHGGPHAAYGIHVFDETQVLVDAGYAVVYANPRGSAGYGREHGRSIRQRMGTVDFHDVIDFFDGALQSDPRLDAGRVGIQGGSYGGYLTAWTIAHDHRFAAAIVERGFLDPVSFQGTSDIGSFFGDEYVGTDPALIAAQNPTAVVGDVATPTLVIHSELDFRCPLEQATRYYTALKRQGTLAEMLVFPGENHELTRSGQPRHRVERFEAILDWWARFLPVG